MHVSELASLRANAFELNRVRRSLTARRAVFDHEIEADPVARPFRRKQQENDYPDLCQIFCDRH